MLVSLTCSSWEPPEWGWQLWQFTLSSETCHSEISILTTPYPSKKKKKKDTLIYPSDWLDSCQNDNLSLAERDLVLVLRLALCALLGWLAPRNGNTEVAAWYPVGHSAPAPASPCSDLQVGTEHYDFSFPHPRGTQWMFQGVDGPICKWHPCKVAIPLHVWEKGIGDSGKSSKVPWSLT